jgi:hypothetical protein
MRRQRVAIFIPKQRQRNNEPVAASGYRPIDKGVESKVEVLSRERSSRKSAALWRWAIVRCSRTLISSWKTISKNWA